MNRAHRCFPVKFATSAKKQTELLCLTVLAWLVLCAPAWAGDFQHYPKWDAVLIQQPGRIGKAKPRNIERLAEKTLKKYRGYEVVSDIGQFGQWDKWLTPAEFRAEGAGDCEDFAIAWLYDLLAAGVPAQKLELAIVQVKQSGEYHAVLLIERRLVLDSMAQEKVHSVEWAAGRYKPVYYATTQQVTAAGGKWTAE